MSFGESIKSCFSKYLTFSGRASRSEFWWWVLFLIIVSAVTGIIDQVTGLHLPIDDPSWTVNGSEINPYDYYKPGWLQSLASLVLFLPTISVEVRRLHDRNVSGWMWWLNLLNCMCGLGILILVFAFYIQPSQPGPNRYGPEPGAPQLV